VVQNRQTNLKKLADKFSRFSYTYSLTHLLAYLLLATALPLMASSYFPEFYHTWSPKLGQWSSYRMTDARGETAELTFSVVAKEGDSFWLELRTKQEGAEVTVAFLLSGDPADDANVQLIRAQEPGGPAMEIDRATLAKLRTQGQSAFGGEATAIGPKVGKLQQLPEDTVTVAGESLRCRHLKIVGPDQTAEVWLNEDVGPFELVKLKSGLEEVVLLGHGKGAKPSLKGPFTPLAVP
jgi:hypothetical protein